jgi:Na+:H+ antiporter, NhaA family
VRAVTDDADAAASVRHAWSASDRYVPRTFVQPLQRFLETEAAGGVVLIVAALAAIVWANGPFGTSYESFWGTPLRVELGGLLHIDHLDLRAWVNDALMAFFFFVAGLEIKREVVHGDLRNPRAAALPAIAAIGGMIVPAMVYVAFNHGGDGGEGWGIPMATDIAFAVGVLSLLGDRVPSGAKIFLLTLAIADDIGAIVVIAIFYTDTLAWGWLAGAVAGLVVMALLRNLDVRSLAPFIALGLWVWLALLESGVHATLAGVSVALLTPAWSFYDPRRFAPDARRLVDEVEAPFADDILTDDELDRTESALAELSRLTTETRSPLERLESGLAPWTAFVVVPIFALANAGVPFSADALADAVTSPVTAGVALGLVLGKPIGITLATLIAVRLGVGVLPRGAGWSHVVGLGMTGGIGFTVALFVTGLSFDDPVLTDAAKLGIFAASIVAGLAGLALLRSAAAATTEDVGAGLDAADAAA